MTLPHYIYGGVATVSTSIRFISSQASSSSCRCASLLASLPILIYRSLTWLSTFFSPPISGSGAERFISDYKRHPVAHGAFFDEVEFGRDKTSRRGGTAQLAGEGVFRVGREGGDGEEARAKIGENEADVRRFCRRG